MRAAQLVGPRQFEFVDVPPPTPKEGEALIRLEYLSVCGSDLRTYDRVLPEEQYPLEPGRPCHELLGVVEESRSDLLNPGQRVIAVTSVGGMVEHLAAPAEIMVPLPESAAKDPAPWVLCQPLGTVIYSMQQLGSVLGKRVVVLGQGPIGLTFTDLLARAGATQVIAVDLHDYRLAKAKSMGATHTVNAAKDDVLEAVRDITGGKLADVTIEATGRPETCHQLFSLLRLQGTAIAFGMSHDLDVFPFDWSAMYAKLPRLIVTNSAIAGERVESVKTAVDLVDQGRLDISHMLTHRLPWKDVSRAFEIYSTKAEDSLKVVMSVS